MQNLKYINLWALVFLIFIQPAKGMEDEDFSGGQIPHPYPQFQIEEGSEAKDVRLKAKDGIQNQGDINAQNSMSAQSLDFNNQGSINAGTVHVKADRGFLNTFGGVN